jgi:hypothetical protein
MLCISTDVLCCNSASWLIYTKFGTSVTPLYATPTSSSFLIPLLAVQPSVNLSLFHSCPPLLAVLQLSLQFLTPLFFWSSSTDSSHLNSGFPTHCVPSGLRTVSFLLGYSSYFLQRCPSHLSLPVFITLTMSGSYRAYKAHYCSLFCIYHYHK